MVWRPGDDLAAETTWRAEASATRRVLGLDLAAALALRRLEDGLGWRPDSLGAFTGQTANGLDLDSQTLRVSAGHEGRFLGWVRLHAQASLRGWSREGDVRDRAAAAPRLAALPRCGRTTSSRKTASSRRPGSSSIAAPWRTRGTWPRPSSWTAYTLHDAYLGFCLVGTHLGVAFLNVLDTRAESRRAPSRPDERCAGGCTGPSPSDAGGAAVTRREALALLLVALLIVAGRGVRSHLLVGS